MPKNCNHAWDRTNLVTTDDMRDTFRCSLCGATGSSFGIGAAVIVDSAPRQKVYRGAGISRTRGPSIETILKCIGQGGMLNGDGREWSRQRYEERVARGDVDANA